MGRGKERKLEKEKKRQDQSLRKSKQNKGERVHTKLKGGRMQCGILCWIMEKKWILVEKWGNPHKVGSSINNHVSMSISWF